MAGPDNVKGNHCKHVVRDFVLLPTSYQANLSYELVIHILERLVGLAHNNSLNQSQSGLVLQVSQQSGFWYQKFVETFPFHLTCN